MWFLSSSLVAILCSMAAVLDYAYADETVQDAGQSLSQLVARHMAITRHASRNCQASREQLIHRHHGHRLPRRSCHSCRYDSLPQTRSRHPDPLCPPLIHEGEPFALQEYYARHVRPGPFSQEKAQLSNFADFGAPGLAGPTAATRTARLRCSSCPSRATVRTCCTRPCTPPH